MNASDRKKLLALPFYMSKRAELPEPRDGQDEIKLFEEIFGERYHSHMEARVDSEDKITEFNYEKYFDPSLMEGVDTNSTSFKELVKALNFESRTKIEAHEQHKNQFRKLMPLLATLTADEKRALVHMLQNKSSSERLIADLTD